MIEESSHPEDKTQSTEPTQGKAKGRAKAKAKAKTSTKQKVTDAKAKGGRTRTVRQYPASSFKDALPLGEAIFAFASGERVRRLTLLEQMDRSPGSSSTHMLITNSSKYGITTGSYIAEFLALTEVGHVACNPDASDRERLSSQFSLAIAGIPVFKTLYDTYVNKKIPVHDVMKDVLTEKHSDLDNPQEVVDFFIVNAKDLRLLRTIAGAETLVSVEHALDQLGAGNSMAGHQSHAPAQSHSPRRSGTSWDTTCFYITPIGDEESDERRHSDLFLSSLIEPAMKELGLDVVRADKIAEPGMITTHILEHIKQSKLVIADLSLLNANVFYEMALRHVLKLPIVQIIQKANRLPFDVNQVNSVIIDNTDIYTFTPQLETYRSQNVSSNVNLLRQPS